MRGFKVVYKERVYNALEMVCNFEGEAPKQPSESSPKFLTVLVLNEDGNVKMLEDEAFMFQFIRIIGVKSGEVRSVQRTMPV